MEPRADPAGPRGSGDGHMGALHGGAVGRRRRFDLVWPVGGTDDGLLQRSLQPVHEAHVRAAGARKGSFAWGSGPVWHSQTVIF